jgi:mannobiose 2-epimerase
MNDELSLKDDPSSIRWLQTNEMVEKLERYKMEMETELKEILSWWTRITYDDKNGGFIGKVDHANSVYTDSPKGAVLNSRILWAFSAAYNFTGNKDYLQTAVRAFNYIIQYFIDKEFGGVYWTVDFRGVPLDKKKQIYALAFAVYGLAEYYHASRDESAREQAVRIYQQILQCSCDEKKGGYIEAFTREWKQIDDLRLSVKDSNEKKTMNTHLHLLEAFTNLYKVWQDESLRQRIIELIQIFQRYIIDGRTNHLVLFFDEAWNPRSDIFSYGHDVEAAWLVHEAAEAVGDSSLLDNVKKISVQLAEAATEGLDGDGGLWYEYDSSRQHLIREKHSWPQAEAMVGFFNAWQIAGDEKFLSHSLQSWQFVKQHMLDKGLGEWYWGVRADRAPMINEEKAGLWKCPYHNSRACIEVANRINHTIIKNQ